MDLDVNEWSMKVSAWSRGQPICMQSLMGWASFFKQASIESLSALHSNLSPLMMRECSDTRVSHSSCQCWLSVGC